MPTTHTNHPKRPRLPTEVRVDASGRLNLGKSLSGRMFKIETVGEEIRLIPARVVTESEAWFFDRKERVEAMDRSMRQAVSGETEEVPEGGIADL